MFLIVVCGMMLLLGSCKTKNGIVPCPSYGQIEKAQANDIVLPPKPA